MAMVKTKYLGENNSEAILRGLQNCTTSNSQPDVMADGIS